MCFFHIFFKTIQVLRRGTSQECISECGIKVSLCFSYYLRIHENLWYGTSCLDHKLGAYKSNKLEKWDEIQYLHFKMYKNYVGRIKTLKLFVKTSNGLQLGAFGVCNKIAPFIYKTLFNGGEMWEFWVRNFSSTYFPFLSSSNRSLSSSQSMCGYW